MFRQSPLGLGGGAIELFWRGSFGYAGDLDKGYRVMGQTSRLATLERNNMCKKPTTPTRVNQLNGITKIVVIFLDRGSSTSDSLSLLNIGTLSRQLAQTNKNDDPPGYRHDAKTLTLPVARPFPDREQMIRDTVEFINDHINDPMAGYPRLGQQLEAIAGSLLNT